MDHLVHLVCRLLEFLKLLELSCLCHRQCFDGRGLLLPKLILAIEWGQPDPLRGLSGSCCVEAVSGAIFFRSFGEGAWFSRICTGLPIRGQAE